jgi:Ca2+/H+ antiporter, TMEM165/GDT1 family
MDELNKGKTMNQKYKRKKGFFILFAIVAVVALGFVVQGLWNNLLPEILGAKVITYWQAIGLFVLCRILFGSFSFRGKRNGPFSNPEFKGKFMNMSEEERAELKDRWRERCR